MRGEINVTLYLSASMKVYKERVLSVAVNCAKQAAKTEVDRFIHLSTAQVYDCDKVKTLKWHTAFQNDSQVFRD